MFKPILLLFLFSSLNSCGTSEPSHFDGSETLVLSQDGSDNIRLSAVRRDHYWYDHELVSLCKAYFFDQNSKPLSDVQLQNVIRSRSCYSRDWKKKCVKWDIKAEFTCDAL